MNSDSESDWDSMSEAPKAPVGVAQGQKFIELDILSTFLDIILGLVIYPPGPAGSNQAKENKTSKSETSVPAPRPTQSTPPKSPVNNFRQKSNILAQQAAAVAANKQSTVPVPRVREAKVHLPKSSNSPKESTNSSRDSGIETSTNPSVNTSPNNLKTDKSKSDTFDDIGGGVDNHGYDEDSLDSSDGFSKENNYQKYPAPEEKISLLTFDDIRTKYFQIQFEDEGLLVDKIIPTIADCCSKLVLEFLGKIMHEIVKHHLFNDLNLQVF